jgi:hypothetical protein
MKRRSLLFLALVGSVVAAILLSTLACTPAAPPHPSIGKWRNGLLSLRVRPDRIATVNGVQCDWAPIDGKTIQISPRTKIELAESGPAIELAFEMSVLDGGRRASLDVFGLPVTVNREDEASPVEEKPVY